MESIRCGQPKWAQAEATAPYPLFRKNNYFKMGAFLGQSMKNKLIIIVLVLIVLNGCMGKNDNNLPTKAMPLNNTTASSYQTVLNQTPTNNYTTPTTPTITPVKTIEVPYDGNNIPLCSGSIKPIANLELPGLLIYSKNSDQGLFTLGGKPLNFGELPVDQKKEYSTFGFSKDGNWFAYSPFRGDFIKNPTITLISSSGEKVERKLDFSGIQNKLPINNEWQGFVNFSHWVGDDQLFGILLAQDPNSSTHYPGLIEVVINPFTNEWKDLSDFYPSYGKEAHISPDKTRIIVLQDDGIHLFDNNREIISYLNVGIPDFSIIDWSIDSQYAAFLGRGIYIENLNQGATYAQVVIFSREGEVIKILNEIETGDSIYPYYFSWSPNGRYLSITIKENDNLILLIFDMVTKKYIQKCPIYHAEFGSVIQLWSPDNNFIAIGGNIDIPMSIFKVNTGEIYRLGTNFMPVGWSNRFSPKQATNN